MAQLQFRSDDTIKWKFGYGNRMDGDASPSGTFSNPKTTFSGTSGASTGTVGSNSGFAIGNLVFIHQTRNGGDGAGKWQLNKIINISGTTFTFLYALTNNYDTTAQIIKINQNKDITLNDTLTVPAWNGSTGGFIVLMGSKITEASAINAQGANGTQSVGARPSGGGYRGGNQNEVQHDIGYRGEGVNSAGNEQSSSASGNAAGGGASPVGTNKSHGAGGGNGSAGTNGNYGAEGGASAGSADLTTLVFGGGAGSGSGGDNSNAGSGANGGGAIILIAKEITFSTGASLNGGVGVDGTGGEGRSYGGNGGGGSLLLKGQKIILGTSIISAVGGSGGLGGTGGTGRIHADYMTSITGITNPSVDLRQDASLIDEPGGGALFGIL